MPKRKGKASSAEASPRPLAAFFDPKAVDDRPEARDLLAGIQAAPPRLDQLLEESRSHWGYEDPVYRFYHQSYKVFRLQSSTLAIVEALRNLAPRPLNAWFLEIVAAGTGKAFQRGDNDRWLAATRPILEAFLHARYFLEMVCKYGRELKAPPQCLPSGWAAVLYLYNLR